MPTTHVIQNPQQQTGPKTGPTVIFDSSALSKQGIDLVRHKFRPSDLGVDAIFAVETWSYYDTVEQRMEMDDDYPDGLDEDALKALEEIAESDTEECLIDCAQSKLADWGVPYGAQQEATLTEKGYKSIVEIKCSFLIESLHAQRHAARTTPLCSVLVDGDNFTFTANTEKAIMTAVMDASGDYEDCDKRSPLEKFGQLEAYCLPWYTHWLLERGYDVSLAQVGEDTRFHVHFYDYRLVPYSGDIDDMDSDDLVLLTNPARPILK